MDRPRVKTDTRSSITHDPNPAGLGEANNATFADGEIGDLIKRVTHVSVETVQIVKALSDLGLPEH